jgi:hypothetical protein
VLDADIIALCAAAYDPASAWDVRWVSSADAGIEVALKRCDDAGGRTDVVVFRGSKSRLDWMRDALSELYGVIAGFEALGELPFGFQIGMEDAYRRISLELRPDAAIVVTGHSLGAAHAALFAGMRSLKGMPAGDLVLCGCPRPGAQPLRQALQGWRIRNYRNRLDRVCLLPTEPPYLQVADFIPVDAEPDHATMAPADILADLVDPFRDHHMALYVRGVAALAQRTAAL